MLIHGYDVVLQNLLLVYCQSVFVRPQLNMVRLNYRDYKSIYYRKGRLHNDYGIQLINILLFVKTNKLTHKSL